MPALRLAIDPTGMTTGGRQGEAALDGIKRKSGEAEDAVTGVGRRGGSALQSLAPIARSVAGALGGLAAGFISVQGAAQAVTMARNFNAAMAETATLIDDTPANMAALEDAARSMAREFGGNATAQVQGLYTALSSGAATVADAAAIMDSANRLAVGGSADAATSVQLLSGVINAYGAEVITAADASDTLFIGVQAGVTTVSELSSSLGAIIPTAKAVGLEFDEVVGGVAALTLNSMNTSAAVTSLNAALNAIAAPSQQAKQLAEELGLEFSAAALEAQGLGGFLQSVADATGGNIDQMATLFGSVEALKTALLFAGEAGGQFADIMGLMEQRTGATDAAVATMAESLDQRWTRATAAAMDVALSLGNALLTVLVPGMEATAAALTLAYESADLLGIGLGVLAATYIPSAVGAVIGLVTWLGTMEGMFIAGAVASRAMAVAMNLLPFVAAATALVVLTRGMAQASAAQQTYTGAVEAFNAAQTSMNAASESYATDTSVSMRDALIAEASAAETAARNVLSLAQARLQASIASDYDAMGNYTGPSSVNDQIIADITYLQTQLDNTARTLDALRRGTILPPEAETEVAGVATAITTVSTATFAAIPAMADLRAEYGDLASTVRDVMQAQNELAEADFRSSVRDLASASASAEDLAGRLGQSADWTADLQAAMANIAAMDAFGDQARALSNMAAHIADASGGIDGMTPEALALYEEILAASQEAADLAVASGEIDFSVALSGAAQLAAQLGVALGTAQALMQMGGGRTEEVIYDPRDPRYDPIAAEMGRLAENYGTVSPFDPSRNRAPTPTGAGSAGGGLSEEARAAEQAAEALGDALDQALSNARTPLQVYTDGLAELAELADYAAEQGVDFASAQQAALRDLNDELADSIPGLTAVTDAWGEFAANGFRDFKGFAESVLGTFQSLLADMIAEAARNRIMIAMGLTGDQQGAQQGGGGIVSSLLSGIGSWFAGFLDGGGNIGMGQFAVVGERGPELVRSTPAGAVVTSRVDTARMLGGGQGGAPIFNIDARGAQQGVAEQIIDALRQAAPLIQAGAVDQVRSNLDGWNRQLQVDGAL